MGDDQVPALGAAMAAESDLGSLRLARGCRCFAAWDGPRVVAYGWLTRRSEWIGEVRLEIAPGPGEAYVWNCVTLPEHRRRGLFRALLLFIRARSREEGCSRLWIGSGGGGAEKALAQAGFSPVLVLREHRLARWRRLQVAAASGAEPRAEAAARAVLGLDAQAGLGRRPGPRRH